jgi:hypothetical protein
MRLWGRRAGQDDNFGINAGQRFRAVGAAPSLWEVEVVARYPGELLPHVRMHRVGSPNDGKTISLQVLRDRRYYQPAR